MNRVLMLLLSLAIATAARADLNAVQDYVVYEYGATSAISPSNITTISTTTYSAAVRIADSSVQSVAMTIDTTQTVSASVSLESLVVDPDGTEHWQVFDPAISKSFTGDYDKVWPLYMPVTGVVRFKFTADATYPYEVERLVLKRK